jgi:hypothetical protein
MTTVQVDQETKEALDELAELASKEKLSRGSLLLRLVANYRLNQTLDYLQKKYGPKARKLGLKTEDDFERYLG